jgi:hypothetical protein
MWQTISALLPTRLASFEAIFHALEQKNLQLENEVLTADFNSTICKLEVFKRHDDWLETMHMARSHQPFDQQVTEELAKTRHFLNFEAPNECEQNVDSQSSIALDSLQFINRIMQALGVPAVLVRCSNQIHTFNEFAYFARSLSAQNLVHAFTRLYNFDDVLTVAGMEVLGQPNVEFPPHVVPLKEGIDLIYEVCVDLVKRDEVAREGLLRYNSKNTGKVYELQLIRSSPVTDATVLESNPIGVLRLKRIVGV